MSRSFARESCRRSCAAPRAREACRQRGAIFVEAIIVCSMLMILFAGAVFFHRLYASKIQATRDARLGAWQPAEEGCTTTFGLSQLFNYLDVETCNDENCSVGGLGTQSDTAPNWLDRGTKTGEVTHTVRADSVIGGRSYSLRGYNRVICNERRQNDKGDLASIGDYILDAVIR